jgi:sugar phosphate permease
MSSSPMTATAAAGAIPWYRTVTREQWRVLLAAKFGWMLDAMDFMLYTMAVGQLRSYFGFGDDTAGMLGTVTLVMSGVGGAIFGYVADRFGRTRAFDGHDPHLLALLAWRGHLANRDAAAHLAGDPRHRHGR